jgi:Acyl-CoA carboxylase epsilon subunit
MPGSPASRPDTQPTRNAVPGPGPVTPAGVIAGDSPAPDPALPVLAVVKGSPAAEEIAALVAVLAARRAPAMAPAAPAASRFGWSSRSARLRVPVLASPGGWRASALPR